MIQVFLLILVVSKYLLTEDDEFLILASDGIWEHLSNEKVICLHRLLSLSNSLFQIKMLRKHVMNY